jgi:tRNA G18 (ribose-2'-O)-methylase SpoU
MDKPIKKLTHQQILSSKPSVKDVRAMDRMPVVLVLDNLRSLYNIGSIFRTADAVLVEKIYLCGITGHPPNKEIEKVALGAVEVVPFEYCAKTVDCLGKLKKAGYKIVALELTDRSIRYNKAKYSFPCALVLGNEVDGVGDGVMKMVDLAVDIPMKGRANSLNVATAMAVVSYEIFDQWQNAKSNL